MDFEQYVKHQLKTYNNRILSMQKDIQEYPAAVLLREANYMVVAYQEVFAQVHAALYEDSDSKATLVSMKEYSLRRVLHYAQFCEHSTSPTRNLFDRYTLAAWAEVHEQLIGEGF